MLKFISFIFKEKDKEFLNVNCLNTPALGIPALAVYYHIDKKVYQWQPVSLMGSAGDIELVIPDMDLLPEILLLISLGTAESEIRRMFNG